MPSVARIFVSGSALVIVGSANGFVQENIFKKCHVFGQINVAKAKYLPTELTPHKCTSYLSIMYMIWAESLKEMGTTLCEDITSHGMRDHDDGVMTWKYISL